MRERLELAALIGGAALAMPDDTGGVGKSLVGTRLCLADEPFVPQVFGDASQAGIGLPPR